MTPRQIAPQRAMLRATLIRSERISPSFVRLTFGGDDLARLDAGGFDQCFRLFFRRPGQPRLRMPTLANNGWYAQWLLMSSSTKPWVRNYTFSHVRPADREADVEFAVHGTDGGPPAPAAEFAVRARPGEEVGFFDEGVTYRPAGSGRQLLVGDESAVPAVLGILRDAPGLRATVVLEVPTAQDVRDLPARDGVQVHWVVRNDPHAVPGRAALRTLTDGTGLDLTGLTSAWVAGERDLATGARRHLVGPLGVDKKDVVFVGYWRHGKASP